MNRCEATTRDQCQENRCKERGRSCDYEDISQRRERCCNDPESLIPESAHPVTSDPSKEVLQDQDDPRARTAQTKHAPARHIKQLHQDSLPLTMYNITVSVYTYYAKSLFRARTRAYVSYVHLQARATSSLLLGTPSK